MNLETLYYLSQVIASVAIVASLVYLAKQIRHSTRTSAVEAKLAATAMLSEYINLLITDFSVNELLMRAMNSKEGLSKPELQRFYNMCLKTFWVASASHFQLRSGLLGEEEWFEFKANLHFWFSGAEVRGWWRRNGHLRFSKPFVEFVDAELLLVEENTASYGALNQESEYKP